MNKQNESLCNKYKTLFSRFFPSDLENSNMANSYEFFYIGNKQTFLNPFLFYFNKNKFYHYNPNNCKIQNVEKQSENNKLAIAETVQFSKTNRELMRRYFLIEKAKDARIFGILIGTMSVANYKQAVDHVSDILKRAQRRYYSFLIGKLNCPKLNNFMEVDMYILIACNENSLINSKELNKPIITLYELEIAFNCSRLWGNEFICDYQRLLQGHEDYLPLKLSEQESDISLITGKARINDFSSANDSTSNQKQNNELINRDDGLSIIHHSGAGKFKSIFI